MMGSADAEDGSWNGEDGGGGGIDHFHLGGSFFPEFFSANQPQ